MRSIARIALLGLLGAAVAIAVGIELTQDPSDRIQARVEALQRLLRSDDVEEQRATLAALYERHARSGQEGGLVLAASEEWPQNPVVLEVAWSRLALPQASSGPAASVLGAFSRRDPEAFGRFFLEHAAGLAPEARVAAVRQLRLAGLSWTVRQAVVTRVLAALEASYVAQGRSRAAAVELLAVGMPAAGSLYEGPLGGPPRCELAEVLLRHAESLAAHLASAWPQPSAAAVAPLAGNGGAASFDADAFAGQLERALWAAPCQARRAELLVAFGPSLARQTLRAAGAGGEDEASEQRALAEALRPLRLLVLLGAEGPAGDAVAGIEASFRYLAMARAAAEAGPHFQRRLEAIREERARLVWLGGSALGKRGVAQLELRPAAVYRETYPPGFWSQLMRENLSEGLGLAPLAAAAVPRGEAWEVKVGAPLKRGARPSRGPAAGARVVLVTQRLHAYRDTFEGLALASGTVTLPNADGQLETWDRYVEKDVAAADAECTALAQQLEDLARAGRKAAEEARAMVPEVRARLGRLSTSPR